MDKPYYYDLLIDLTTSTPSKTSRPTLYLSKPQLQPPGSKGPTHRLTVFRFTWSDIRLVHIICNHVSVYVLNTPDSGMSLNAFCSWTAINVHSHAAGRHLKPMQEINPHLRGQILGEYMKTCVLYVLGSGWGPGAATRLRPIPPATDPSPTGAASD
jgi:hypothetical protein